ncbi:hypothetical protein [Rhizobium terrae]|uniref:hypothetical protein n=1 Tax=Rhizobium terrae TaxID=2171756 RepID=UPI000E3C0C12|nr:hypothetical protein [Rhizobium terrae]
MATKGAPRPFYRKIELASGYVHHRFYRGVGWESAYPADTPQHAVLNAMHDDGAYSLIQVINGQTRVVGPVKGVENPVNIITGIRPPFVAVTGGFYVHYPNLFRESATGPALGRRLYLQPVGYTSLTSNFVPVDPAYSDDLIPRTMGDGSVFTAGPSLVQPMNLPQPHFTRINSAAGKHTYFAKDDAGREIPSPLYASFKDWDLRYNELKR